MIEDRILAWLNGQSKMRTIVEISSALKIGYDLVNRNCDHLWRERKIGRVFARWWQPEEFDGKHGLKSRLFYMSLKTTTQLGIDALYPNSYVVERSEWMKLQSLGGGVE